jgi:hypothetical protein
VSNSEYSTEVQFSTEDSMTQLVKRAPPNNNNFFDRAANISFKLNLRVCDRAIIKLLLLGGARFTDSVVQYGVRIRTLYRATATL